MSVVVQVTPHDPLVARDGRPFGAGQGNRMRGLPWPLPSVVAGSFRTALVKAGSGDFSGDIPQRLMQIAVAGVFPVHDRKLYLPAPNDAVAEPNENGKGIKFLHRVVPHAITGGCDLPESGLQPVMLSQSEAGEDFKPAEVPAWWPVGKYAEWLLGNDVCFDSSFLRSPLQEARDHVCLDAERGAAAEGQIFATAGLNVTRLPRFDFDGSRRLHERPAEITLSGRITIPGSETALTIGQQFGIWHPLGGERRMVHWQQEVEETTGWNCPAGIRSTLATATKVRMVLVTPAVFKDGWKPGWLTNGLEGELTGIKLKLVGVSNGRWKAVSGWSLADTKDQRRGPKPIRRMVPAGSVYFFEVEKPGDAAPLVDLWLQSVSDDEQERRDGFGLAAWGIW
jgi:CRISPR-associated protein Cmr3